jgi:hypothetical protein
MAHSYPGESRGCGQLYSKTKKSLRTVHVPEGLGNELWLWKQECPNPRTGSFHLSQLAQAKWGKAERLYPHGQLPRPLCSSRWR